MMAIANTRVFTVESADGARIAAVRPKSGYA